MAYPVPYRQKSHKAKGQKIRHLYTNLSPGMRKPTREPALISLQWSAAKVHYSTSGCLVVFFFRPTSFSLCLPRVPEPLENGKHRRWKTFVGWVESCCRERRGAGSVLPHLEKPPVGALCRIEQEAVKPFSCIFHALNPTIPWRWSHNSPSHESDSEAPHSIGRTRTYLWSMEWVRTKWGYLQLDLVRVHFINPSSTNHLTFMGILIASHCIDSSPFLQFSEIMQYFKSVFYRITRFSWGVIDINSKNEKLGWISGENFLMARWQERLVHLVWASWCSAGTSQGSWASAAGTLPASTSLPHALHTAGVGQLHCRTGRKRKGSHPLS